MFTHVRMHFIYLGTGSMTEKELKIVVDIGHGRNVIEYIREQLVWAWYKIFITNKPDQEERITQLRRTLIFGK